MARPGKKRNRKRKVVIWVIVLAALAVLTPTVFLNQLAGQMPDPKALPQPETTTLYDSSGKAFAELGKGYRTQVPCTSISPWVPLAVMAAEDHNFYNEDGISYAGVARAMITNALSGHIAQGGSTITQQYVKNKFLSPQRTYGRKMKELVLARKVENSTPKDQILCNYLNTIYFGRGASGIEAAAKQYFNKSAAKLTLSESAYIAAIIRNPGWYENHQDKATARRNLVLTQMSELANEPKDKFQIRQKRSGQIWAYPALNSRTLARAQAPSPRLRKPTKLTGVAASQAPYVASLVEQYVTEKYGADAMQQGLKITTTINLDWQNKLDQQVSDAIGDRAEPRIGATVMDVKTGAIRAMYGGPDITTQQYDAAHDAQRQAGSTMKPVVLAEALNQGIPISTKFDSPRDKDVEYGGGEKYHVENYHRSTYGKINLEEAIWHSVNTVYVPLDVQVGPDKVADLAKKMGGADKLLDSDTVPDIQPYPSTALGANVMSTVQAATMYSTLANRGEHNPPFIVQEIKDAKGNTIEKHKSDSNRVLDKNVADNVNQVLHTNTIHGSAAPARIDIPSAGKTGTSNVVRDMRYNGFTPSIATAVWIGNSNNSPLSDNLPSKMKPVQLWHDIMSSITAGQKAVDFPTPKPIKAKKTPKQEPTPTPPPSSPSPTPTKSTTPAPTPTPTPTPTETSSTPAPTPTPTPTAESPKPSVTPSETPRQRKPAPTPTPTPTETPQVVQVNNGTPSPSTTPTRD